MEESENIEVGSPMANFTQKHNTQSQGAKSNTKLVEVALLINLIKGKQITGAKFPTRMLFAMLLGMSMEPMTA